jgi:hypothetical protein
MIYTRRNNIRRPLTWVYVTRHRDTPDGERGQQSTTSRRQFLRATATTVVGATGVAAASGTAVAGASAENAEAPADFPRVTTRDHFDDDANLSNGETASSYQQDGDWSSIGSELTLFVHGWNSDASNDDDIDTTYEASLALDNNGYGGDVAVYSWDSDKGDSWDLGWSDANSIAEKNGQKLANYITDRDGDVRLLSHSLGARVTVFALESLREDFGASDALESVTLIGGAVENDDVSLDAGWFDDEYGQSIEYGTRQFDNFWNDGDGILNNVYQTREFDTAVGADGIEGPAPNNYTDVNVSDTVDAHGDYYKRDVGCVDQIVYQF